MDTTLKNKLVFGTTLKESRMATIYGDICLEELSILKIVLELRNDCGLVLTHEQQKYLDTMSVTIQNKYPKICNYREKRFNDIKFIN